MSDNHGKPTPPVAESPRRPSRHVSSPWTQIVCGESEPIASAAEASDAEASDAQALIASVVVPLFTFSSSPSLLNI
ncbi:unnamed protein product [Cochlearia groenlandica]